MSAFKFQSVKLKLNKKPSSSCCTGHTSSTRGTCGWWPRIGHCPSGPCRALPGLWAGAILHQSPCDDAQGTCWPGSSELSPHNRFLSLTRPRPFLTLSAWFAPRLGQVSLQLTRAPCFAVLGPAHPGMVQGPCWTGRAE